jgi:hypothetical protein
MKRPESRISITVPVSVAERLKHCLRCDAWWLSRTGEDPARCPHCKRRYWDVPAGTLKLGRPAAE